MPLEFIFIAHSWGVLQYRKRREKYLRFHVCFVSACTVDGQASETEADTTSSHVPVSRGCSNRLYNPKSRLRNCPASSVLVLVESAALVSVFPHRPPEDQCPVPGFHDSYPCMGVCKTRGLSAKKQCPIPKMFNPDAMLVKPPLTVSLAWLMN